MAFVHGDAFVRSVDAKTSTRDTSRASQSTANLRRDVFYIDAITPRAAPSFTAHETPMKPADLAVHNCLHFTKTDSATRGTRPRGKGQARLPEVLVHKPLNRNPLVTVLDDDALPAIPLHLRHVGGRHLPP